MALLACAKCDRRGKYSVARLIERYGREGKLVDWKDQITADCPRRANARVVVTDQCGAYFPDLLRLQIRRSNRGGLGAAVAEN